MEFKDTNPVDYHATQLRWKRATPWYRRASAHMGLQGKLVLCFLALLSVTLGSSCWIFVSQSRERLADMIGEQARQISYTLALAGKPAFEGGDIQELNQIGQDLLKSRNILFVGFLDVEGRPIAFASRDPDFEAGQTARDSSDTQSLMQVRTLRSPVFGEFLEVVAPVLSVSSPLAGPEIKPDAAAGTRLMGYVAVGMSPSREQAQLQRINYFVIGIGCLWVILSLPMAYLLVHRIFHPIRQLVAATNEIAGGQLDTQVAIHRPDIIGTLARSFNEMVQTVKRQQEDLESANNKLADANRDLEKKVLQRTGQLEAANKRLSNEIAEKEDFLRAVSHDLNAPLRNISGMATMLLMKHREKFDADIIHRLERIQKNVEVETDLITELLELSRIKTRRQKFEPVEINAMVRELGEIFEDDLRTRQIKLVIDNPLPVLKCERARLRQVFQNLIDNAIKYMGDGQQEGSGFGVQGSGHTNARISRDDVASSSLNPEPQTLNPEPQTLNPVKEIHVGWEMRDNEAHFYVRDTGMGIDPEDLDKVFFVFRRGKNGQARNVAGKGVGLASVKSIVETYNGSIWVESTIGVGSTFRFTINGQYLAQAPARAVTAPAVSQGH